MEMDYPWSSESFTPGADPFSDNWLSVPYQNPHSLDIKYEFLHDKVQEACYEMIPEDQLPATHLNIGRNLKEYSIQSDEVLFEVCNHIGAGKHLLRDGERNEMAILNLNAARKAMTRAAFEHALQYSLAARSLSGGRERGEDDRFELGVSQILVQSLFSLAKYDEALKEAEGIVKGTGSELARVVIGVERIRALRSLGRNRDAYEQGLSVIKSMGLRVPEDIWDVGEIMAVTMSYKNSLDTEETIRVCSLFLTMLT
jgi:predicted ATPase